MIAVVIAASAVVATGLVLMIATWLVGRAEERAERLAAEDWEPPKHTARTLGRPNSKVPWT